MKRATMIFLGICIAMQSLQPLAAKDAKELKELISVIQTKSEKEIIEYFEDKDIDPEKVYSVKNEKVTALMGCILLGKYKVARYLIEEGADCNFVYKDKKEELTPLGALFCFDIGSRSRRDPREPPEQFIAASYELARLMIKKGADVKAVQTWDSGKKKESIFALVMYAGAQIRKHDLSFLQYLIDKGADPHGITNLNRQSHKPHSFYFLANNMDAALFLMDHNVRPYKQKSRITREEVGKISRWDNRLRVELWDLDTVLGRIDALLGVGVKPEDLDLSGTGAMSFVIVEYLCRKGADINVIGPNAAQRCDIDSLKAFIRKGLEVDSTIVYDKKLRTLLANNISRQNYECTKFLLEKGASLSGDGVEEALYFLLCDYARNQNDSKQKDRLTKMVKLFSDRGFCFSDSIKTQHRISKSQADFFRKNGFEW